MFLPPLLSLALMMLSPWFPGEAPPYSPPEARPPVVLAATAPETSPPDGFDAASASRRVLGGVMARLRSRGASVRAGEAGAFLVALSGPEARGTAGAMSAFLEPAAPGKAVTLSVGFGVEANRWASGSETRFGGEGDDAWRLAAAVQSHLVGGLRDVLDYPSYDRGVVEQPAGVSPPDVYPASRTGDPWVAAYPLFSTNPSERAMLEWPETLDLLSAALADAVGDYLDPSLPTPPRVPGLGWRQGGPWQPVSPRLLMKGEQGPKVALTFDGGASSAPTPAILKALREAGVHATMFMTTDFVEKNPALVVQMAKDGHEFGNHSSTHPDMTKLSTPAVIAELDRLESAVQALTGKSTRPWFRPPYGAYDDRLVRTAAEQGYYTVYWTADSADWRDDVSAATVEQRLLRNAAPGAILIEHLGSPQSAQVLAEVLRLLKQQGFTFGTLSEVAGSGE